VRALLDATGYVGDAPARARQMAHAIRETVVEMTRRPGLPSML